ncbi:hypothetical protein PISMIDRAFT_41884, partial [Pisolithus microcarpus 441]
VEFLPVYLPDFNPIKQAFSVIKAHIHNNAPSFSHSDTTGTDPADADVVCAVYSVTPEKAWAFYQHSGY